MAVKIHFDTDNAAFCEDGDSATREVERILRDLADDIRACAMRDQHHILRDLNGNRIGEAEIHIHPDEEG